MSKYQNTKIFRLFYNDQSVIGYTLCNLAQKKYLLKKKPEFRAIFEEAERDGGKVNIVLLDTKSFSNIEEAKGYVYELNQKMKE